MEKVTFKSLELCPEILSALEEAGYEEPTEIQSQAIPEVLKGKDIMATAQTGTGKTAAFAIPLLELLVRSAGAKKNDSKDNSNKRSPKPKIKALILSPTRELSQQIEDNLSMYGKHLGFKTDVFVGGMPIKRQINKLQKGVDIVVATPGRLLDLLGRKALNLRNVEFFVLDEADRMLDMGFVHDVQDIARSLSKKRQTMLFSATTSPQVDQLSSVLLQDPKRISVDPPQSVAENIAQKVLYVDQGNKRDLLVHLLKEKKITPALIFTTTKSNANVVAAVLNREGIEADSIHSDKKQKERQEALRRFSEGEVAVLVATDVMARGIDVDGISHVINFELPLDPENFVHRIGRTARAGASGVALSFCDNTEVRLLNQIESFAELELEVDETHPYHSPFVQTLKGQGASPFSGRGRRR